MLQTQDQIKKVYSFLGANNQWDLTDNEEVAKKSTLHSLVDINDLHQFVAGCGYIFKGLVETTDGIVEWFEETTLDEHGFEDCTFEYRIVH